MNRLAFVLGGARSGTTWLAKIIDSHPDVIYRHEPDIPNRWTDLPLFCHPEELERYLPRARQCIADYATRRHVRASGVLPFFRKSYMSETQYQARKGLIYLMRGVERVPPLRGLSYRVPIPDFAEIHDPAAYCVIKSVNSLGRANLLVHAAPQARAILAIRHPCGYVSSRMRLAVRVGASNRIGVGLPQAEQAQRRGLTLERIEKMSPLERLAWVWTIFNEKAMEDLSGLSNVSVLRYEDLCASPLDAARAQIAFLGLDWHSQVEAFLRRSTSGTGAENGFTITRDTNREIGKWRNELDPQQIRTIFDIVSDSLPGRLFQDSLEDAESPA